MSKIIVDSIQTTTGVDFTLPATTPSETSLLAVNTTGGLEYQAVPPTYDTTRITKVVSLTNTTNSPAGETGAQIMWTDIAPGINTDNVVAVKISGYLRSSTTFQVQIYGLDATQTPITAGYLGYGHTVYYNGQTENLNNGHNSNNGYISFPTYGSVYGDNGETANYGSGILFDYQFKPQRFGTYSGHHHLIQYTYQQSTSYNFPNHGQTAWNNYAASVPPETWHGVTIIPNSGTWSVGHNEVVVELLTKTV